MADKLKTAILGASGYTGAELVRLLAGHPHVALSVLTADRNAGQPLAAVYPHLRHVDAPELVTISDVDFGTIDVVFCALPHTTTQTVVAGLPDHIKIVDLSADFRLANPAQYSLVYGNALLAPDLQKEAVYGLTEVNRAEISAARLVANPGCYPTGSQLSLIPLLKAGLIDPDRIIIDAKSGVTGAGRGLKQGSLFAEVAEDFHAYGVGTHRHAPEIEQGLSLAAGREITVTFTPHLAPMKRGILSTIYVTPDGSDAASIHAVLEETYAEEPFVRVLSPGETPHTAHVTGSNLCDIAVFNGRAKDQVIVVAAIDNLVKGASGQAVQNLNAMCGFDETTALTQLPLFP